MVTCMITTFSSVGGIDVFSNDPINEAQTIRFCILSCNHMLTNPSPPILQSQHVHVSTNTQSVDLLHMRLQYILLSFRYRSVIQKININETESTISSRLPQYKCMYKKLTHMNSFICLYLISAALANIFHDSLTCPSACSCIAFVLLSSLVLQMKTTKICLNAKKLQCSDIQSAVLNE